MPRDNLRKPVEGLVGLGMLGLGLLRLGIVARICRLGIGHGLLRRLVLEVPGVSVLIDQQVGRVAELGWHIDLSDVMVIVLDPDVADAD